MAPSAVRRLPLCLVVALCAAACASSGDTRKPTAALSNSREAEGEMHRLVAAWAHASRNERQGMEPALAAFRQKYADDPLARLAEALLSWIDLDRNRLHVAEVRAHWVRSVAGPGTVGDIARTVEGAALLRQGHAEQALELLLPLQSKLIDPWARALYNQEVLDSAVEAQRWDRALSLMRVWLREAGLDERATARAHIEASLERVPPEKLVALLDDRGLASTPAVDEDVEMRKLVAQRLAFVARARKDAELAQHLLTTAGALLGEQGDVVARLSAGGSRARVEERTVGLLFSLRSDRTRRRGADIADGVAFGLGLPGSAAHLVSRDDHGSPERLEEALAALSADGASVVIGGSDEQEAAVAAAYAEAHHIPVLLLTPPPPGALPAGSARFAFVVGAGADDVEGALGAALVSRGAAPITLLADDPVPTAPRPPVSTVRSCADASAPWQGLGVILSAEPECVRAAIGAAAPRRVRFAAGLDSTGLSLPPGSLVATAGAFPFSGPAPALGGWLQTHLSPPNWWAALGRDAAVLAWAGVNKLPDRGTEDPNEVEARRSQAAAALASTQAELWTTEANGFGGGHVLPRKIGVRETSAAPR